MAAQRLSLPTIRNRISELSGWRTHVRKRSPRRALNCFQPEISAGFVVEINSETSVFPAASPGNEVVSLWEMRSAGHRQTMQCYTVEPNTEVSLRY